jgi:diadenosine tetraphosphate (Ap4A) HIT family hydrolase
MAIARAKLVDLTVNRWCHCVSRCVRKAFLLGEGDHNRREWLENRLEELAEIFAVSVDGFAVMHNHLHVLVRLEYRRNWLGSSREKRPCTESELPGRSVQDFCPVKSSQKMCLSDSVILSFHLMPGWRRPPRQVTGAAARLTPGAGKPNSMVPRWSERLGAQLR